MTHANLDYRRAELAKIAFRIFRGGRIGGRAMQTLRPFICPFGPLLRLVPEGSRVLDVGCGSGLFLGLLASEGRISSGRGFDASGSALRLASTMTSNLPALAPISIHFLDVTAEWPLETFDCVSIIDVMHHVPPTHQQRFFRTAAERVAPGGFLLYKDMVSIPRWRAWANRLHDLIVAKQWISYARMESVCEWAAAAGLEKRSAGSANMFWYGHEWALFSRP